MSKENFISASDIYKEKTADKDVQLKAREESIKLQYDTFKHLTTLNTASILLLITFLEKLFSNPNEKFLVSVAFVFFGLSNVSSLYSMMQLSDCMSDTKVVVKEEMKFPKRKKWVELTKLSFFLFIIGIFCLGTFGVINFLW